MVLKGLKVLTGRVSDLCLSGHELPLVQYTRASGSCRVSKHMTFGIPSFQSTTHGGTHWLPSEFTRHWILDNPPHSFAIQAGKGGKTDMLGKTLGQKYKPLFNTMLCNSPLALICLINSGCSACMFL